MKYQVWIEYYEDGETVPVTEHVASFKYRTQAGTFRDSFTGVRAWIVTLKAETA